MKKLLHVSRSHNDLNQSEEYTNYFIQQQYHSSVSQAKTTGNNEFLFEYPVHNLFLETKTRVKAKRLRFDLFWSNCTYLGFP